MSQIPASKSGGKFSAILITLKVSVLASKLLICAYDLASAESGAKYTNSGEVLMKVNDWEYTCEKMKEENNRTSKYLVFINTN